MSNKTVSGYTNLLQRLALALSDGAAEAEVDYVPVSRTPYVRLTLGDTYAPIDALRRRIELALAGRGFSEAGPNVFGRRSEAGWVYVDVGSPDYDPVRRCAWLDLSVSGPYRVEQRIDRGGRDPEAERRAFESRRLRAEADAENRLSGMRSVVGSMLRAAPFEVPREILSRLANDAPSEVLHAVARALGGQGLDSYADLADRTGHPEFLGHDPGPRP